MPRNRTEEPIPDDVDEQFLEEDDEEDWGEGEEEYHRPGWTPENTNAPTGEMVSIETGRGNAVQVPAGSNFVQTVEGVADQASYGGFFRVYLNGDEIVDPSRAPEKIEPGMRIAITSYDKVG